MSAMNEPEYVARDRAYQERYYQKNRDKKIAYQRQYLADKRDEINAKRRQKRVAAGLSVKSYRVVPASGLSVREYNKAHYSVRGAERLLREKVAALQRVCGTRAPACCKCGCTDVRVLTINHLNGDGRKDLTGWKSAKAFRKAIADGTRSVSDLDVRCFNCNILYEYERGRFRLPPNWEAVIDEVTGGG